MLVRQRGGSRVDETFVIRSLREQGEKERERKTEGWNVPDAGSYRETGDNRRIVGYQLSRVMIYQVRK